jgi:hypothetical protein
MREAEGAGEAVQDMPELKDIFSRPPTPMFTYRYPILPTPYIFYRLHVLQRKKRIIELSS